METVRHDESQVQGKSNVRAHVVFKAIPKVVLGGSTKKYKIEQVSDVLVDGYSENAHLVVVASPRNLSSCKEVAVW